MTDREFLQLLHKVLQHSTRECPDYAQLSLRMGDAAKAVEIQLQRPAWSPLVDADIEEVWADEKLGRYATSYALEAKLKAKNT